jgi:UDP-N-acetylmuramate dehydrogenase
VQGKHPYDYKFSGGVQCDAPLSALTTLKVGGAAKVLWSPSSVEELCTFKKEAGTDIPHALLGDGSNTLVADSGFDGVVIRLKDLPQDIYMSGKEITMGAGVSCGTVARFAREAELDGLAFWCGIPGSVGGALYMNAGAYGRETVDALVSVSLISPEGERVQFKPQELDFSYRQSGVKDGWIIESATFKLADGSKDKIKQDMRDINRDRSKSQPLNMPSSGSWFTNPKGQKSWQLVDSVGGRGQRLGDAAVSEKHSNFFVNHGAATAGDMLALSDEMVDKIYKEHGILMTTEVQKLGNFERV